VGADERVAGAVSVQRLQLLKGEGKVRLTCFNQSNKFSFVHNRRITAIAVNGFLELGN
jgi:hypothetical protein